MLTAIAAATVMAGWTAAPQLPPEERYGAVAAPPIATEPETQFARFVETNLLARLRQHQIGGAVFVAVRDGRELYRVAMGYANLERRIPVDVDRTMFLLASVSKPFTTTAVAQLVERGKLKYSDTVNSRLRSLQLHLDYSPAVTVANLLTHTTGLPDLFLGSACDGPQTCLPLAIFLRDRQPRQRAVPGAVVSYENLSNAVAAQIVADVSGENYPDYLRTHIWRPLKMAATYYDVPGEVGPDDALAFPARNYEFHGDSASLEPAPRFYSMFYPAGQVRSSGADMGRFIVGQLESGSPILGDGARTDMQQLHAAGAQSETGFGWGWSYERERNGTIVISHGGDLRGVVTDLRMIPSAHFGYFVAVTGDAGDTLQAFADAFDQHYLGSGSASDLNDIDAAAPVPVDAAGIYRDFRFSASDPLRMYSAISEVIVAQTAPRELRITVPKLLGGESYRFTPSRDGQLRAMAPLALLAQHATPVLRVIRNESGQVRFIAINLPNGYQLSAEPVPLLQQGRIKYPVLLCLLVILVIFGVRTIVLMLRYPGPAQARWLVILAVAATVATAVSFPLLILRCLQTVSPWDLLYGLRHLGLGPAYMLPWLTLVSASVAGACALIAVRGNSWSGATRLNCATTSATGLLYVGLLAANGQVVLQLY